MGPRAFAHGDPQQPGLFHLALKSSMGPRAFAHGDTHESDQCYLITTLSSMGPRAFAHGDAEISPRSSLTQILFNGAAGFRPRRPRAGALTRPSPATLQWGRGLSPTETAGNALRRLAGLQSSMGPRAFAHGDDVSPRVVAANVFSSMGPRAFAHGDWAAWMQTRTA